MTKKAQRTIWLRLPYPPSANRLYRNCRGRITLSKLVLEYRREVAATWFESRTKAGYRGIEAGDVRLRITAYPPDKRRRDIDNILKVLCDSLQHAGIIANDSLIRKISIFFGKTKPGGELLLEIRTLSPSTAREA